jgi:outer membrane receptor protein involved in Fe transport
VLILLLLTRGVLAQNYGGIRGVVTDKEFDVPLSRASVMIAETGTKTETNPEGLFVFHQLSPGNYTVIIEKPGFARVVKTDVIVTPGSMASIAASLPGHYVDMAGLVVRPLQLGGDTEIGLLNLRVESIGIMDGVGANIMSKAGAGSAAEAMQLVSGSTVQEGKYAVIRGLSDRFVNTRINGIELPTADPDVRAVQLDLFPSALLESVRVYKTFTPDLPGNTSGGSVDIITNAIPSGPVLEFNLGVDINSQATRNGDFLSYHEGGVGYFGTDEGSRDKVLEAGQVELPQRSARGGYFTDPTPEEEDRYRLLDQQTRRFNSTMGTSRKTAPLDHNWGVALGNRKELSGDLAAGWLVTTTYENSFSYYDNGKDRFKVGKVDMSGYEIPLESSETTIDPDQWDVEQGKETVRWGISALGGIEKGEHSLTFLFLHTHHTEDEATILKDNHTNPDTYWHNQSLMYTERSLESFQVSGVNPLSFVPEGSLGFFKWSDPKLKWSFATGEAEQYQPDRRFFLASYTPETGIWGDPRKPESGWAQRSWREIIEENDVYNLELIWPFSIREQEGEFKVGENHNDTERTYEQDTFLYENPWGLGSYAVSPFNTYTSGTFGELWTDVFLSPERLGYPEPYGQGLEFSDEIDGQDWQSNEHNWVITGSTEDVDYEGDMTIKANYIMARLPVSCWLTLTGGARWEDTEISTDVDASDGDDQAAKVLNVRENPDRPMFQAAKDIEGMTLDKLANADIDQTDILPSFGLIVEPWKNVKIRGVWSKTIARPTFKEITPVAQQDYVGGSQFAGNPDLNISEIENYDLRVEWIPGEGRGYSISGFYKDITDPIDYSMRPAAGSMPFIIPFNYENGKVLGVELEIRENLSIVSGWLENLGVSKKVRGLRHFSIGSNFTYLDATVQIPDRDVEKIAEWIRFAGKDPDHYDIDERKMKNQPEYIANVYVMYDNEDSGTSVGLFWNRKGETLVAGEDGNGSHYIANMVEKSYDSLNFSFSQRLWGNWNFSLKVENILNDKRERVWQSDYISGEETATSYREGVTFSFGLSWKG